VATFRCSVAPRLVVVSAFAVHASLARVLWKDVGLEGFYVSLGLVALAVVALRSLDEPGNPSGEVDRFLGDLSYPLFLCHFHAGALVLWALPSLCAARLRAAAALGIGGATVLAWAVHRVAEAPLVPLRSTLRRRPSQRAASVIAARASAP
jgi:peptidoglycan/LPS O-acetylase OafA/YrhL